MVRLVSWNVGHIQPWDHLDGADVALLQELREPPACWRERLVFSGSAQWETAGRKRRQFQAVVARMSNAVALDPTPMGDISSTDPSTLSVSRPGTLAAAGVVRDGRLLFTAVSMYATWENAVGHDRLIYADASAHNILSDLAALAYSESKHRIIAAGDLNILRGYGEDGSRYWARRYQTVFDRFEAMGLRFVGPQVKEGVVQADPHPRELPADSLNVPTFRPRVDDPQSATRQLDFVFASRSIADLVEVTALNSLAEWGPSDHCRVRIDVNL